MGPTKRTRILHVIPTLGRAGAERQLVSLVVNASQHEHIVCYLREPSEFAPELRDKGIKVIGLNSPGDRGKWLKTATELSKVIKEHRPDIVQTWLFDANVSARLTQIVGPRVALITAIQSPDYEPETIRSGNWPPLKVSGLRHLDQITARISRPHFVACSKFVKESAREHLKITEESIDVIYNSVDPSTLMCDPNAGKQLRESAGIPQDAVVFLNVGRLSPEKGQEYLIRAFQKVAAAEPNAYLAIAGDGPLKERFEALASDLGIIDRLRLLGRHQNVGPVLEMADVFVFPSLFEGLGLALVEAMFKKLPCIVSRIPVLLEVVSDGQSGLTFAPRSVDELVDAMLLLCRDPELRRRMGARGEEIAQSRFHQRHTIPQWEKLYDRIVPKANTA